LDLTLKAAGADGYKVAENANTRSKKGALLQTSLKIQMEQSEAVEAQQEAIEKHQKSMGATVKLTQSITTGIETQNKVLKEHQKAVDAQVKGLTEQAKVFDFKIGEEEDGGKEALAKQAELTQMLQGMAAVVVFLMCGFLGYAYMLKRNAQKAIPKEAAEEPAAVDQQDPSNPIQRTDTSY